MRHTSLSPPSPLSPLSSPPPRQNKAISQKEYREKEGEGFNILRNVIRNITGEDPGTRLEILKKGCFSNVIPKFATDIFLWIATDLLLFYSRNGNRCEGQATSPGQAFHETSTSVPVPKNTALAQSCRWIE